MYFAFELAEEGKSSFGWLRNRLKVISYEDIGLANPDVVLQVSKALDDMDYLYQKNNDEWRMVLAYVILLMCRSKKSRLADYFKVEMKYVWDKPKGTLPQMDIQDYHLDYHTTQGNKMGRNKGTSKGVEHFIKEGEKLENEKELEDSEEYKKRVHKIWRKG